MTKWRYQVRNGRSRTWITSLELESFTLARSEAEKHARAGHLVRVQSLLPDGNWESSAAWRWRARRRGKEVLVLEPDAS